MALDLSACHGSLARSVIDLDRGILEQCRLCKVIGLAVSKYCDHHGIESYRELRSEHYSVSPSGKDRIELYLLDAKNRTHWVYVRSDEDGPYFHYDKDTQGSQRSRPDVPHGRLYQANLWLRDCISKHAGCKDKHDADRPKRLLDIDGDRENVRLVEGLVPGGDVYACLSHCWGGSQPLRTLKGNLHEHSSAGISFEQLPPTFIDFVKTCLFLEIRYVWIDSLCIVQDDDDDWSDQARKMASVYGNAVVTVATTRAAGCHQGFLEGAYLDEILHFRDESGECMNVTGEAHDNLWQFKNAGSEYVMPLNRRAWTFQEHFLSPRSLMFGTQEMAWECQHSFICHQHGEHRDARKDRHGKSLLKQHLYASPKDTLEILKANGSRRDAFFTNWVDLLQNYVNRELSFDKDRLIALAGVIDAIASRTSRRCYAGHWDACFLESLTWWVSNSRPPTVRRAPTWSWASIEVGDGLWDCQRSKFDQASAIAARVVSVNCPAVGSPVADGDEEMGALVLDAWLVPARLVRERDIGGDSGGNSLSFQEWTTESLAAMVYMDIRSGHECDVYDAFAVVLGTGFATYAILSLDARADQKVFRRIGMLEFEGRDATRVVQTSGRRQEVTLI